MRYNHLQNFINTIYYKVSTSSFIYQKIQSCEEISREYLICILPPKDILWVCAPCGDTISQYCAHTRKSKSRATKEVKKDDNEKKDYGHRYIDYNRSNINGMFPRNPSPPRGVIHL